CFDTGNVDARIWLSGVECHADAWLVASNDGDLRVFSGEVHGVPTGISDIQNRLAKDFPPVEPHISKRAARVHTEGEAVGCEGDGLAWDGNRIGRREKLIRD